MKKWTLYEDKKLRQMREGGFSWPEIDRFLKRDPGSSCSRHHFLKNKNKEFDGKESKANLKELHRLRMARIKSISKGIAR